ncbi:NUDIX hydrolase [Brachybacterium sacelli]|uniref:8-oxo-dGTP pyrophosphatase MutT (NUDIX family) n=1 Tax=Brachybacterium sacelli TaxID=173364 RepID=A0ABS4X3A7_9MICO|nr:CoA pyrophosphatase [Brachybacterium sacelli]MBP2382945.1 8-oxo-dGTP pyrophosphatase MutT (NUDIX family) [Brachybacterium sacelli]
MTAAPPPAGSLPDFMNPLSERARRGEVLVRRGEDPRDPGGGPEAVRRSAVLLLITGTSLGEAEVVLEERGHALRSQPGQFSLPGGGADPGDRDDVHTALREAQEETGLDPRQVQVLGAFAPIPMPWRVQRVTPVLGWAPSPLPLGVQDPVEVERVVWARLTGPGSLTDPAHRRRGLLRGQGVGPVFELPEDAFVWGFTAMILEQMLVGLGLDPAPPGSPPREIPPERRR